MFYIIKQADLQSTTSSTGLVDDLAKIIEAFQSGLPQSTQIPTSLFGISGVLSSLTQSQQTTDTVSIGTAEKFCSFASFNQFSLQTKTVKGASDFSCSSCAADADCLTFRDA